MTASSSHPRATGFTLVEVVVVMLIFSVVIAMAAVITRGVSAAQKRALTATRLASVESALIQFVVQQRRLPCPADGAQASTANNAGLEVPAGGGCAAANLQNGVLPWRTLGITESEATDGWDRRLTYRLDPALTSAGAMDMSWCDPAGEAGGPTALTCVANCVASACTRPKYFLNSKGLQVRNIAGTVLMNPNADPHTGAAYVVISHGESGGGGYLNTGILGTSTIGDGTEELKNYASLPYVNNTVTYYVDDSTSDVAGTAHFDDVVLRPSVLGVVSKAGLGPRAH